MSDTIHVKESATAELTDTNINVAEATRSGKLVVEGNRIKNVHLVGVQAKNKVKNNNTPYTYKESALKQAAEDKMYENVAIFVGHTKEGELVSLRDPSEKIGYAENVVFKEGAGLFGDVVLNEKHNAYEAFVWWAKNKPDQLMMSHEAACVYSQTENAMVKIAKVHCIAFVNEGSTTTGLFKEGLITDKIEKEKMLDIVMNTFYDICYEVKYPLGKSLTQDEKALKLVPVIEDLLAEVKKLVPTTTTTTTQESVQTKENDMLDLTKLTLDELRKTRKDLVDAIAKEAVESHIDIEEGVKEALKDIPTEHQAEIFVKQVREAVVAKDKQTLTQLVEDRKALVAAAKKADTTETVESVVPIRRKQPEQKQTKKLDLDTVVSLVKQK